MEIASATRRAGNAGREPGQSRDADYAGRLTVPRQASCRSALDPALGLHGVTADARLTVTCSVFTADGRA